MQQKLLVVDDEESIVTLLQYNLEQAGFDVSVAMTGKQAVEKAEAEPFDLIVLDVMLPEMDGLEVCKSLRGSKIMTPILMLTAKDDEFDKVLGLELGADDYLTKPFSPREVVARVRAILRRAVSERALPTKSEEPEKLLLGEVEIYPENYEVYYHGEQIELTPKEFELLIYLMNHQGRALTREQLLNAVWNYDFVGDTRIVDVHISHLRDKIEPNSKKPVFIKTVRGLGYKLETADKYE
ncbi:response regulator transcription factor [Salisediminibacterium halotolerans]|uniref:Two-component system, OmpR family, alkaline phosphatase synthesis response regulator PhoP n=1 Tax=Salisediminibacterium halotolerans TaxID=517425 RepID=A0A1H9U058_9BACI|nr:response regulator transcription factor [Salisediminibacterium haloalkalitolerans]SES02618.1 two-component system, OmpR family, alkaline phosphatase synthesis response regulator PhoP [Salisediminibacterium haloalkalitolerans]